jgi:hydroxymethylpyrimidine/phosphomethylpyrimidine kinase
MTAITAITAQNTVGVRAIHPVPPEIVLAQVRAVQEDIGIDAVKVGMLGNVDAVRIVAEAVAGLPAGTPVVVDPVMVAESGARLLEREAESALVEMLPLATVVTPNLAEARVLAGLATALAAVGPREAGRASGEAHPGSGQAPGRPSRPEGQSDDRSQLARAVRSLGPQAVVVTGGDAERGTDVFFDGGDLIAIPGERHSSAAAHGSGCTHSAALAALMAWGRTPLEAARGARTLGAVAVRDGLRSVGAGAGPVDVSGLSRAELPDPDGRLP